MNKKIIIFVFLAARLIIPVGALIKRGITNILYSEQFIATADLWEDLRFPAQDLTTSGVSDPSTGTFRGNTRAVFYSGTTMNQQFITFQLPHGRRKNTPLLYHWHFTTINNGTGNVEFCVEYVCANIHSKFNQTTINCINTSVSNAYIHYMTPAIRYNNSLDYSAMCNLRIYRDGAADTYNENVALLEFDVHYINERFGLIMEEH